MFDTWVARGGDPGNSEAPIFGPRSGLRAGPYAPSPSMVGVVGFALAILLVVLPSSGRAYT
jgi:hypothetical protein